jgi:hypothetical protein
MVTRCNTWSVTWLWSALSQCWFSSGRKQAILTQKHVDSTISKVHFLVRLQKQMTNINSNTQCSRKHWHGTEYNKVQEGTSCKTVWLRTFQKGRAYADRYKNLANALHYCFFILRPANSMSGKAHSHWKVGAVQAKAEGLYFLPSSVRLFPVFPPCPTPRGSTVLGEKAAFLCEGFQPIYCLALNIFIFHLFTM